MLIKLSIICLSLCVYVYIDHHSIYHFLLVLSLQRTLIQMLRYRLYFECELKDTFHITLSFLHVSPQVRTCPSIQPSMKPLQLINPRLYNKVRAYLIHILHQAQYTYEKELDKHMKKRSSSFCSAIIQMD